MSRTATDWAWSLSIKPASLKLLLLSMADRADEGHCCYPSIARLVKDTGLNKKTIQSGILKLVEMGILEDTGERKGPTQRVRVFCLEGIKSGRTNYDAKSKDPKNGNIKKQLDSSSNDTENGNVPEIGNVPKNGTLNDTENGVLNDPENGVQNHPLEPPIESTAAACVGYDEAAPGSDQTQSTVVLAPSKLFDTSTPDHKQTFQMHVDWQPTAKFSEMCRFNQINLASIDEDEQGDILREFITYWITNGDRPASQGEWERRFMNQIKRLQVRKFDSPQTIRAQVTAEVMDVGNLDWMKGNIDPLKSPKNKRADVSRAIMNVGDTDW
ncbi:helix-turn-helix domain-containing protein [Neptunomonas japonica]|uniref:Primosomal protein n=1 Tax=Neptunomonas japonica JAMM 1380 TaxID=1441457 RepID=A0A7R6P8U5_9GAMM|nr:helix-turn-helix domain-containing protein [Neptunomonas japonica]BBB29358.1 primosomal protein [Neptunomonas japonica JAMM 1380]